MKAIAFTATYWDCPDPGCGQRNFLRDVVLRFDEIPYVGPEEPFECSCGYCLSGQQELPVTCCGCLRQGWWFTCHNCFHDTFLAETLYGTDALGLTTERPPSPAKCTFCGEESEVTLPH